MKLNEIFDQLTYGELSQLSIGGGAQGTLRPEDYNKVVAHVNLGLTALYKRFNLKEGRFTLTLQPGQTTYPINSKYAVSNRKSREAVRFITDTTAEPFLDDILKIERCYSDSGFEFGLNNVDNPLAILTPTATTVRVPAIIVAKDFSLADEMKTDTLEFFYRANARQIVADGTDLEPESVEVELPYTHLEPLLLFVASRVHTPGGITGEFNAGNNYFAKYEASCQELEAKNLRVDQDSQPNKLERNGWV